MQRKVSMVMTCYNKVAYIGAMFDSIIAQEWDNIELILVNDGSTDGTREVIAQYEPRFRDRGFEVVIIDQVNTGVCAAAKAGLEKITGDYVCVVDADDELYPQYTSLMAGWLEDHPDCDIVSCGFVFYSGTSSDKVLGDKWIPHMEDFIITLEDYFRGTVLWPIWGYMLRKDYFLRCRILETYYIDTKGSHEPAFMVPMTSYNGTVHAIQRPLVYHNRTDPHSHSVHHTFTDYARHYDEYFLLCQYAINALSDEIADNARKKELCAYVDVCKWNAKFSFSIAYSDGEAYRAQIRSALYDSASRFVRHRAVIKDHLFNLKYEKMLFEAVNKVVFKKKPVIIAEPKGKVVAFGAMGKNAANLLPWLSETYLQPTVLWDQKGDGITVQKPDFSSLCARDVLLCLPLVSAIADCKEKLERLPCRTVYYSDIVKWIANYYFCERDIS